jgi:predicted nucleotidyltransferase
MTANTRSPRVSSVLAALKRDLRLIYGVRLRRVILYGSHARADADEGSDLDLMVVLDHVEDPLAERERLSATICNLSLKHNVVLSVGVAGERSLAEDGNPLYLNVRREGIPV